MTIVRLHTINNVIPHLSTIRPSIRPSIHLQLDVLVLSWSLQ